MKKILLFLAVVLVCHSVVTAASTKVAVIKSWGLVPAFTELNDNWSAYGTTPLEINTSLIEC